MRHAKLVALLLVLGASAAVACSAADSAFSDGLSAPGDTTDGGPAKGATTSDGPNASPATLGPTDNGVILVNASGGTSFRLCFEAFPNQPATPSAELMPEANVVGVDLGAAVRIGALPSGAPGKIRLYPEPGIRGTDPKLSCNDLADQLGYLATEIGTITEDLSRGVHLVVVTGCPAGSTDSFSVETCGEGWTSAGGNLTATQIDLQPRTRDSKTTLPTQVLQLSRQLEAARGAKAIRVGYGAKDGADVTSVTGPKLDGPVADFTAGQDPTFDPTDLSVYASMGFRVSIGDTPVLWESLATIQDRSAPRDLPTTYYAAASNYVLLLLGTPPSDADGGDAGAADKNGLHFLVVPVVAPKADAGADGGDEAGVDGGP